MPAARLVAALKVTSCAVAQETTPYALDSLLFESDEQSSRLVVTDGRRPAIAEPVRLDRRWDILIKHVYQIDPLLCPQCGGSMKIIAFIGASQGDTIRKILEHCGLWHDPPPRGPPCAAPPPRAVRAIAESESDSGITPVCRAADGTGGRRTGRHEIYPDFLEHLQREAVKQPELPWEA